MLILGLNFGHDAAASVVRDGQILSVILRERVNRVKRTRGMDRRTIEEALAAAGVDLAAVDFVALSTAQRHPFVAADCDFSVTFEGTSAHPAPGKMMEAAHRRGVLLIPRARGEAREYINGIEADAKVDQVNPVDQFHYAPAWLAGGGLDEIASRDQSAFFATSHVDHLHLPVLVHLLGQSKPGYIVNHHLCHAAVAYYTSPFEDAFILTMDGSGSIPHGYYGGMIYQGRGGALFPIAPHHLYTSCLYDRTATWLGLGELSAPGKLMGLAPYGEPLFADDRFIGNWYDVARKLDLFISELLSPPIATWMHVWQIHCQTIARQHGLDIRSVGDKDKVTEKVPAGIARSIQMIFEETVLSAVRAIERIADANGQSSRRMVFTGGSALNVVANQRILQETGVEDLFVNPGCDDMGLSTGAAMAVFHAILGHPRERHALNASSYLGRGFTRARVKATLEAEPAIIFEEHPDWCERAAREIADGGVIGWFEGRSEIGPRALGHRSIVADPTRDDTWERVNRVKGRELWRPLAPSVLEKDVATYFSDVPTHSPFMGINARVTDRRLPAVTHLDGTSRIQSVDKSCGAYHEMIAAFGRLTGVPVVLNTSFNGPDEPIVDTPDDALRLFVSSDLDALYIEGFRVTRRRPSDSPAPT